MTAAAAIEKSDAMPQARQARFGRTAASYTAAAAGRIALLVAQVICQLRTQRPLQQRLLQPAEQPVITQQVLRPFLVGQKLIQQFRSQCHRIRHQFQANHAASGYPAT